MGLGLLLATEICGTFDQDDVLRCPSNRRTDFGNSQGDPSHPNYQQSALLGRWVNERTPYLRNFFPDETAKKGARIDDLLSDRALHADMMSCGFHVEKSHVDGVNVMWVGGSVRYIRDAFISDPYRDRGGYRGSLGMRELWDRLESQ